MVNVFHMFRFLVDYLQIVCFLLTFVLNFLNVLSYPEKSDSTFLGFFFRWFEVFVHLMNKNPLSSVFGLHQYSGVAPGSLGPECTAVFISFY